MRLLFITDFTEQFAYRFLRGIYTHSQGTEQWVVCKMPPSYKRQLGMEGVVKWAKEWRADVVIAQFYLAVVCDFGHDLDCGEGSVSSAGGVEGGYADETVNTVLALEEAVGIVAFYHDGCAL